MRGVFVGPAFRALKPETWSTGMIGPAINVAAYDPKGIPTRNVNGTAVAAHVELFPIQIEPFGTNEVKISIDGVARIVDAFALGRAINEALTRFRGALTLVSCRQRGQEND